MMRRRVTVQDRARAKRELSRACFEHGPGRVAKMVGVSRYTVWAWETGRHTISDQNIPRLYDGIQRADMEDD